jgi:glycosyltransferase involved in cell wall biosynthesis
MSALPGICQVVPVRWFNAEADYALRQGLGLARRGWPVTFLAVPGTPIHRRAGEEGLVVEDLPDPSGNSPSALARAASAIRRVVRRRGIGIVNFHRSEGTVLMAGALRALSPRPIIVRTRGEMRRIRKTPFNRIAWLRSFDAIVASGRAVAAGVEQDLGLPLGSVGVIPYGVDIGRFAPGGRQEVPAVIGYVGRLGPVKGVSHLLDAAQRLVGRGAEFTLKLLVKDPGEYPSEYASIDRRVHGPLLAGRVLLEGHVPDLPSVMRGMTAGVVSSVGSEANCRTAAELMACAVPLVVTGVGSLPEVVEHGVTGFVVPPADDGAMAEALARILADPAETLRMGEASRKRVEERFSLEGMIDASERLFLGLREKAPQ